MRFISGSHFTVLFALLCMGGVAPQKFQAQTVQADAVQADTVQADTDQTDAVQESVARVAQPPARPSRWAQPIQAAGAPNLFQVSDTLYRSAQPSAQGMRSLKGLGVETILNLRSLHSDRDEIGDTRLVYAHIHMKAWNTDEEDLVRFLAIVTNEKRTPVLVHCRRGSDRTGLVCATYRVVVQGWTKKDAIEEMIHGGYGFNSLWSNIVNEVRDLDVVRLRTMAGLEPTLVP